MPPKAGEQIDLFAEPVQELLRIIDIEEHLDNELFPKSYGGDTPADVLDWEKDEELEVGEAWVWDEREVKAVCPRGLCLIDCSEWACGCRHCRGC